MLLQASVAQIRSGEITKRDGYIAITMCRYPRGLRRELRHEYISALAPDCELLAHWRAKKELHGHHQAFDRSRYQYRFRLTTLAWRHLRRLSLLSKKNHVYLVCQCAVGERCHREILLLLAHREFRARTGKVYHDYPVALRRLKYPKETNEKIRGHQSDQPARRTTRVSNQ